MSSQRILIVEDERIAAEDLASLLRNLGYEVTGIVANGPEAIETAATEEPDLILMDIMLQGEMDGITAAKQILERQLIPVIFTTAYGDQTMLSRAEQETSPYGFIQKPYSDRDIQTAIKLALRRGERDRQVMQMNHYLRLKDQVNRLFVAESDISRLIPQVLGSLVDSNLYSAACVLLIDTAGVVVDSYQHGLGKHKLSAFATEMQLLKISGSEMAPNETLCRIADAHAQAIRIRAGDQLYAIFSVVKETASLDEHEQVILQDIAHDLGRLLVAVELREERARTESRLQDSERRLRTVMDNTPSGILMVDDAKRFEFVNSGLAEILGYEPEELIGRKFDEFIEEGREKTVRNYIARRQGEKVESRYEITLIRKDGSLRNAEIIVSLFENLQHEVKTIAHVLDVTEEKFRRAKLVQLSRAVEQSPVSVVITDTDGSIEYVNPKFCEVTGYTLEEALGENPRILKSGDQGSAFYRELWDTIKSGKEWQGEFHNRKKSGEYYWEVASISPIKDENGRMTHFVAVKEDITERKLAEESLRISEERFRRITSAALDAIIVVRNDGTITFWNDAAHTIFGYTRKEALGAKLVELLAPDRHARSFGEMVESFWTVLHEKGASKTLEGLALRKDGKEVPLEITATSVQTEEGIQMMGVARDIGARKEAERLVKRANAMQNVLYNITNAALSADDLDELYEKIHWELGKVVDATNIIIGLHEPGSDHIDIPFYRDAQKSVVPEQLAFDPQTSLTARTIDEKRTFHLRTADMELMAEKGESLKLGNLPKVWLGFPLIVRDEIIGAMVLQSYEHEDVYDDEDVRLLETAANQIAHTIERKRKDRELVKSERLHRRLAQELGDANGMKELLLDVITHDLRNPASVISGIVELMEYELDEQELVDVLRSSSDSLLKVIENASVLSKLTLGEEIEREEMDFVALIKEVIGEFSSQLQSAEMEVHTHLPEALQVKANPIISEVIKNYISNAIKYASDGKRIDVHLDQEDERVHLQVIDHGPTIPSDKRELVFERKVQLATGVKKGQGLGLAIVKRIAEAHHGEVGCLPNEPRGNIFFLRL